MLDAMKGYLQLASGITEVTVTRAREVAGALVAQGLGSNTDEMVGGVQQFADELWATGKDNREMLLQLVRMEVDRAVARMGFVREDELASLRRHVDRLESELARAQTELAQVREDSATSSIMAAAEAAMSSSTQDVADSVVDSARRIVAMTGALSGVPGLTGGPWARVARDLATSAAGIVAAAGEATSSAAKPDSGSTVDATVTTPSAPAPRQPDTATSGGAATVQNGPTAQESGKKKSGKTKSENKNSGKKKSNDNKSQSEMSQSQKSQTQQSSPSKGNS